MPEQIVMPRLSDTMETGTVARWLKRPGDEVKKGEPLADIETDKATLQLESFSNGQMGRILLPEGQSAPIGTPIAELLKPGEEAPAPSGASASATTAKPVAGSTAGASGTSTAAPPRPMPSDTAPPSSNARADSTSAVPAAPPPAETNATERPLASPLARRIAEELGVDLAHVRGSGPNGRITREDVEAAAQARPAAAPEAAPTAQPAPVAAIERPLTRMQETIARRMVQSKTTVPHFYVTVEADLARAAQLREQLNVAWSPVRVGFEEMVAKAVAGALGAYPQVNASWRGDHLEFHADVNVGVATATETGGLVVPVLHRVNQTDLKTLAGEIKALRQRVREGKSQQRDFEGGTFTISNLGPYGVDEFYAIVNPPESGILAIGAIERKPIARGDTVVISERLRLCLSGDHRVFYGVQAAQFLAKVKELLENPLALLK